jgi:hypothetical protein
MNHADAHGMLMWVENRFLRYIVQPLLQSDAKVDATAKSDHVDHVVGNVGNMQCQPKLGSNCAGSTGQADCVQYSVPCRPVLSFLFSLFSVLFSLFSFLFSLSKGAPFSTDFSS